MISLLDNLSIKKSAPDVERQLHEDLDALLAFDTRYLPEVYEVNLKSDGSRWRYMISNAETETGKWRKIESGASADLSGYVTKTENDLLLANKVDKETDKSLVLNTEIERLATLENYDDSTLVENIGNNATAISELQTKIGSGTLATTAQNVIDSINEVKSGCESESSRIAEQSQANADAIAILNGTENG